MIKLNNCTNCGRKPDIHKYSFNRYSHEWNYYAICECLKHVNSTGGNIWSAEVAADMWNRANPVEEKTMHDNQVNRIADELAICGIKADVSTGKLILSPSNNGFSVKLVMSRIRKARMHETELTEFYRRRLEPATTS